MKGKKAVKIAIDVAMAAVFVAVVATALVQEVPHEYLGIALFVLIIVHALFNRRWLAVLPRGRWSALRVVQLVVLVGLVACILGQVASSFVLSKYAYGFLPAFPGASWARRVHMLCSYWSFVFAFAHVGLHVRRPRNMAPWQRWALRAAIVAIACYGVYSFIQLGLAPYLAGQVQFAAGDYVTPLPLLFARYASVAVLVASVFHCVRVVLSALTAGRKTGSFVS